MATILDTVSGLSQKKKKEVMGVAYSDAKLAVYAPVVVGHKGEHYQLLYDYLGKGYEKALIDGEVKKLRERIVLDKNKKHTIDILIDELYVSEIEARDKDMQERLSEALEKALTESNGLVRIKTADEERLISAKFMCPYDGFAYPEIEPRLFSFNSPYGACPTCNGLGTKYFLGDEPCPTCHGARLREEALHVFLGGEDRGVEKQIYVHLWGCQLNLYFNFSNILNSPHLKRLFQK